MSSDDAEILRAAAEGYPIREIAAAHRVSEDAVKVILDREALTWFDATHLRRELLLEVTRLNALARKYFRRAMDDDEGSTAAGLLYTKLVERKCVMLGLNSPTSASIQIINRAVPSFEHTTTDLIEAALDFVAGVSSRERQLANKQNYSDEPLTADEEVELSRLRGEREVKRLAKLDQDKGSEPLSEPH